MRTVIELHQMIYQAAGKALENRPEFGYVFSAISTSAGVISFLDITFKLLSIVSVVIGITVGVYTLRLQRAKLAKIKNEKE